ncbi:MAG TPA: hypothetical protein VI915_00625 [Thermoplasmata archaeon]|nr:hypothetical protein [Thermoplasmata archaeon]
MHASMKALTFAAVLALGLLAASGPAAGALDRPAYAPGDRWVYVLEGSIVGPPELNGTTLDLVGRVEVEVAGLEDAIINGTPTRADRVLTRTTSYLNGTFAFPTVPPTTATVTGTLSSNTSELWEVEGYQTIASAGTSELVAEVTYIVAIAFEMRIRTVSNATVAQADPFPLEVGDTATASLHTDLLVNTTLSFLGNETSSEDRTVFDSEWRREVLALETVHVEAGDFAAYRVNQTAGGFAGFPFGGSPGDYEISHFSNDVGYYVERVSYTNGTPVSEMRLKSYTYAARAPAMPWLLPLAVAVIVAAIVAVLVIVWRRRRRARPARIPAPSTPPGSGGDRAR